MCVLAALAWAGCSDDIAAVDEALSVRVEAGRDHLIVTNGRHEAIHWFAITETEAAFVDWLPCTGDHCPTVAAQTIARIPYSQVQGADSGGAILFYWWHSVTVQGGPKAPGRVEMLRVER